MRVRGQRRKPSILRFETLFERHFGRTRDPSARQSKLSANVSRTSPSARLRARSSRDGRSDAPGCRARAVPTPASRHRRCTPDPARRDRRRRSSAATASATNGEVARLAAIAVNRDGLVRERGGDEAVERHVWPLPRSVDRDAPHRRRRDAMVGPIELTEMLGRQLGDAVRRQRPGQRILRHGDRHGVPIKRGAGRVRTSESDGRRTLRAVAATHPRCASCRCESRDPSSFARRPAPPGWNTCVTPSSNGPRDPRDLDRSTRRTRTRLAAALTARFRSLMRARVVVGEAVDARRPQCRRSSNAVGQVRSDEPGRARDERLHANTSRTRAGSLHGRPRGRAPHARCARPPPAAPSRSRTHFVR